MCAKPSFDEIKNLMKTPEYIRNVCILAHVDHGKTTIADLLLATNHLISKRLAGTIRYLDDRIDEQERGITMKSSAVTLINKIENNNLLINLIDTPGHIDFSSEVNAALRISDGTLIIVDLVEGVCVQTREAIKQSFSEKCRMILILNKIDKLIVELKKECSDIFQDILRVIEDCNAIIAELYQYEYGKNNIDIENSGYLFSPENNNIIFASAIDGWGFTTIQFATLFINSIKNETLLSLNKKIWNFDAYVDSKTCTIKYGAIEKNKMNLFTQLCLKTIHYVYTSILILMEKEKINIIIKKLNITNITRDMMHTDPKIRLKSIMQAWSSLAYIIILNIRDIIPPPSKLDENKIHYLLNYNMHYENETDYLKIDDLVNCLKSFTNNEPTIVYVSKMFCINKKNLSQNKPRIFVPKGVNNINCDQKNIEKIENLNISETMHKDFIVIAMARVFHGVLKTGQEIYVLPSPSNNNNNIKNVKKIIIKELYVLFGRDLVLVDKIESGNICGIGGLDSTIHRSATLSTSINCISFIEQPTLPPIVRNSIEPINPIDLPILREGLRILLQSDSCVQVMIQESGEIVLLTAGDVHLAKCLEDLNNKFAKIPINVSSPIVSLRETIKESIDNYDYEKDLDNLITIEINHLRLSIIVVPLLNDIINIINKNIKLIQIIQEHQEIINFELINKQQNKSELKYGQFKIFKNQNTNNLLKIFKNNLDLIFDKYSNWSKLKNIWNISLMYDCINLLINKTDYNKNIFTTFNEFDIRTIYDYSIIKAFKNCCKSGPICEEPIKNCAFIITKFELLSTNNLLENNIKTNANIEISLCTAFRDAFSKQLQRLMEPIFTTKIQVNTNILGKVYSVVSRRHGKILDAVGMDENEKMFLVKAQIPIIESSNFANDIRKTTSGQALPSLKFSHFELIDGNPYYEPIDDEDDIDNIEAMLRATKLRKEIRKRKGLHIEEQVVQHAEKQRTLKK